MHDCLVQPLLAGLGYEDSSLAAFAQLATLRLDIDLCLLSLFDESTEHVVGRATKSSSLISEQNVQPASKDQDVGQHVQRSFPIAQGPSAPALERWKFLLAEDATSSPPVLHGRPGSKDAFLAAAPIVHSCGTLIGCLSVSSAEPRDELDSQGCAFLSELTATITKQLSLIYSHVLLDQTRNMARGLDVFYAGGDDIAQQGKPPTSYQIVSERKPSPWIRLGQRSFKTSTHFMVYREDASSESKVLADLAQTIAASNNSHQGIPQELDKGSHAINVIVSDDDAITPQTVHDTFNRACRLMLNVSKLDGLVFFDATTSADDQSEPNDGETSDSHWPGVLGFSMRSKTPFYENKLQPEQQITANQLRQLMKAFPHGRAFILDSSTQPDADAETLSIADCIPDDAVSLAFVPFWEAQNQHPLAGCFAWITSQTHILEPQIDLPFISVFGHAALSEYARIRADAADSTKSRFIESITHELRSPLHGILGGIEFMRAAQLQVFEKHMLDTVESCGNTLLDLIENVLDMSGINAPAVRPNHRAGGNVEQRQEKLTREMSTTGSSYDMVNMIEEVMMSALLAHITLGRALMPEEQNNTSARKSFARSRSSELLKPRLPQVIIQTDWRKDWTCSVSAGAVRRIILSLFSNALKFTVSGHIMILAEKRPDSDGSGGNGDVSLSIIDTGRGLGESFLRGSVGKAFQQEDILTPGAGLGLHLVQKSVRQLGGEFQMHSTHGEGTKAEVRLPTSHLVDPDQSPGTLSARSIRHAVAGLDMALLGWDTLEDSREYEGLQLAKESFKQLFETCFGMNVLDHFDAAKTDHPVVVLCDDLYFEKCRADGSLEGFWRKPRAFLVFCSSIRYAAYMSSGYPNLSFLTPPPGPNQLSRVLARYFKDDIEPGSVREPDGPVDRVEAAELIMSKAATNEQRFQAISGQAEAKVQSEADKAGQENNTDESNQGEQEEHKHVPAEPSAGQQEEALRLLLVEDNNINMQLLVRFAKKQKLHYETAKDGLEALQAYEKALEGSRRFRAVIMDISMPVMDGLESTRRIRALEQQQKLSPSRIVALTGAVSETAREDALKAGCDVFLAKPASFQKIKDVLDGLG